MIIIAMCDAMYLAAVHIEDTPSSGYAILNDSATAIGIGYTNGFIWAVGIIDIVAPMYGA